MRAELLWHNFLLKASPLNTITMAIQFQYGFSKSHSNYSSSDPKYCWRPSWYHAHGHRWFQLVFSNELLICIRPFMATLVLCHHRIHTWLLQSCALRSRGTFYLRNVLATLNAALISPSCMELLLFMVPSVSCLLRAETSISPSVWSLLEVLL